MKLNLGSGDHVIPGFTNVDLYDEKAEVRADICELPFPDSSIEEIVAYQVIEHVPYWKSQQMFQEMYRVLRPRRKAYIETPDIDVVCRKILEEGLLDKWVYNLVGEYYRPWDKLRYADWENNAASIHRNPWNYDRVERYVLPIGFKLERRPFKEYISPFEENMRLCLTKLA